MPRSVVALLLALGLAGLAGGPVAADGGIDAAGQVFFTFDFGGGGVESRGPRFGLRLGLQGDKSPSTGPDTPEPEPFVSAMSLRFALNGPAEASLGGLTVPLGFNLFGTGEDQGAGQNGAAIDYAPAAYAGQALQPEREPLVTAAGSADQPTGQRAGQPTAQGLEAMVAPSAGAPRQQAHASGRWHFRALAADAAPVYERSVRQEVAFSRRSGPSAGVTETVVERGDWHFRAKAAGRRVPETSSFQPIARMLLRHLTGRGITSQDATTNQSAPRRAVQVARHQHHGRSGETPVEDARGDRWVFRPMVERDRSDRGMTPAALEGTRTRSKRRHLPIR